ncbi:hypothetical protein ACFO1V_01725, partial [Daeguia caeni]
MTFFKYLINIFTGTLFSLLRHENREDLEKKAQENFDAIKQLSDFVSVLIRFAFIVAASSFLMDKALEIGGLRGLVLGICAVSAYAITIIFAFRIFLVIYHFEQREIYNIKNKYKSPTQHFIFAIRLVIRLIEEMSIQACD